MFPFEPYINEQGELIGLMYQWEYKNKCPLIGQPRRIFNPEYIKNSEEMWKLIFAAYPAEYEMYQDNSAKARKKFKKSGRKLPFFSF